MSRLKPETVPFVTDASTFADAFRSSCVITTPGKPMMWIASPMCAAVESPSGSAGMSAASSRSNARSCPDIVPAAGAGLYFATVARECDFAADLGDDDRDGRLRPEQGFLDGDRGLTAGGR